MCVYLTISFNKEFEGVFKSELREGFFLRENKNPFFAKNFARDFVSYDVTDGHCSCSIYPDLLIREATDETAGMIEKYRKKGWSENKIRRAIDERKRAGQKDSAVDFRQILAQLYRRIGSFRLFAHTYKGSIEDEPITAANHKELKIAELLDKTTEVPEDVIIKIKK